MRRYLANAACTWLMILCGWFCLWVISFYFVNDAKLAVLFFPFALRLGVTLHTPIKHWPAIYGAEWMLTFALALLLDQPPWFDVWLASVASIPLTAFACRYYHGTQAQRLWVQAATVLSLSVLNLACVGDTITSLSFVWLISLTGGLMLVPTCYLIWNYLFENTWQPLTSSMINPALVIKCKPLMVLTLLFSTSFVLQLTLPDELRRFAPFCLAIPIIFLAFRYGWQGAILGTLVNSIALIAARSGVSGLEVTDLLLSITAQTLTGILLGVAVQRQRDLNQQLRHELSRNQHLARQLVTAEETVRHEVARELHDEIGQNITAIRTQANIIKRVTNPDLSAQCATTIESLSLNVYDTTKGLLTRLRPIALDELDLHEALTQLVRDMEFTQQGIQVTLNLGGENTANLNDTTRTTLYRICQEALNNIHKYAQAKTVRLDLHTGHLIRLTIIDDGIGFQTDKPKQGLGLKGMRERVQALGGQFSLSSVQNKECNQSGTTIHVQLPGNMSDDLCPR
ncbi:signal transduction histidine-protein kinase/phosphatase UhpB [Vibrio ostreicida]|uniref:Signal transduction histidine-protein kinase/phosphatase UhpB n=1 Tax=Vibrio ostreicida TaxID=526588 RepID=A0ABT8BXW6_9VIBR|nr:signal transduction histidine-protein kinase/phosphatase UhpB [Vibrio ostreicida]MDN3611868.1 signal transduction histidine-protein kinase/phosphatase UhpB [Vibrio ostreicida]NPD09674.1 signal transduction histidine-protein kinase/phosphatase UhpB [Vibrio ostreicida]